LGYSWNNSGPGVGFTDCTDILLLPKHHLLLLWKSVKYIFLHFLFYFESGAVSQINVFFVCPPCPCPPADAHANPSLKTGEAKTLTH